MGKRCTSLAFPKSEDSVLVAHKSGDIFSFSLADKEAEGQLLLGHVSMLLDVVRFFLFLVCFYFLCLLPVSFE